MRGWYLDTQAFPASGAGQDGAQLAALDLLQYGLAGDTEGAGGVVQGTQPSGALSVSMPRSLFGEADAPGRAGGDLLAGDEAVIQPAQQGRRCDVELAGGWVTLSSSPSGGRRCRLGWWRGMPQWVRSEPTLLAVYDIPRAVRAVLPVEDPGDDGVGVVHGQPADQVDGVLIGADFRLRAAQRDGQLADRAAFPPQTRRACGPGRRGGR